MKLKFITSLLAVAAIIGSAGFLSSCKDTDEDRWLQLKDENLTLSQRLDQDVLLLGNKLTTMQKEQDSLKKVMDTCKKNCLIKFDEATRRIDSLAKAGHVTKEELNDTLNYYLTVNKFNLFKQKYDSLVIKVDSLQTRITKIENVLGDNANGVYKTVAERFDSIESAISLIDASVALIPNIQQTANDAYNSAQNAENRLNKMDTLYQQMDSIFNEKITNITVITQTYDSLITKNKERIDSLRDALAVYKAEAAQNLKDVRDSLKTHIDTLVSNLNYTIGQIQTSVNSLNTKYTNLEKRVKSNEDNIKKINNKLTEIVGRVEALENRISGILIQEINNPVTGNINLPIGVQSLILFNYYGEANGYVKFPNFEPEIGQNFGLNDFTVDPSIFKGSYTELGAGERYMNEADGNLGKVYFTINPANIDLTGKEFFIVNSQDTDTKIVLKNVQPSKHLITFGYSRGEGVALYEADATISKNNLAPLKFNLQPGLKSAVKNALKNRTLGSIANVGRLLYEQFDGFLPALAMKATWKENDKKQAAYSQFNIAATTFQPLSYSLAEGVNWESKLPSLPTIDQLKDKFNFELNAPHFKFDKMSISIKRPEISFKLTVNTDFTIDLRDINATVHVPAQDVDVYDENGKKIGVAHVKQQDAHGTITNTNELSAQLNDQLKKKFDTLFNEVEGQIRDQLIDAVDDLVAEINSQVNKEINKMLDDVAEDIDTNLQDVFKNLQNQVNDKIDKLINKISGYYSKVEKVYGKIQDIFRDPNQLMQVMMLYSDSSRGVVARISNSMAFPSQWKGNGTAVTLLLTTYNAEILSPAYLKYCAITNVYDKSNNKDCSNDAMCKKLRNEANAGKNMNKVLRGDISTVDFNFANARNKGGKYTYEIFYQALDFHGYTSTQTFYVTIK